MHYIICIIQILNNWAQNPTSYDGKLLREYNQRFQIIQ